MSGLLGQKRALVKYHFFDEPESTTPDDSDLDLEAEDTMETQEGEAQAPPPPQTLATATQDIFDPDALSTDFNWYEPNLGFGAGLFDAHSAFGVGEVNQYHAMWVYGHL